jgi:hypothetical protein
MARFLLSSSPRSCSLAERRATYKEFPTGRDTVARAAGAQSEEEREMGRLSRRQGEETHERVSGADLAVRKGVRKGLECWRKCNG